MCELCAQGFPGVTEIGLPLLALGAGVVLAHIYARVDLSSASFEVNRK